MRRAIVLLLLAALAVTGCGGDSDSTSETSAERIYPYVKGPSREFLVAGEDNAVQTFGSEATKGEREAASRVIEAWIRAREKKNWRKGCRYLSKETQVYLARSGTLLSQRKVKTCAKGWAIVAAQNPVPPRKNNMDGPIDSLRIREKYGYAQYHGSDGLDWIVPVMREGGTWKVTESDPIERFK